MSHDRSKDGQGIKIDGVSPQGVMDGLPPYIAQEVAMLFFEQVSNLPLALDGPPDETSLDWPGEGHGFVHSFFACIRLNLEALEFSPAPGNGTGIDRPKFDCGVVPVANDAPRPGDDSGFEQVAFRGVEELDITLLLLVNSKIKFPLGIADLRVRDGHFDLDGVGARNLTGERPVRGRCRLGYG
jgi:hypothetical protein